MTGLTGVPGAFGYGDSILVGERVRLRGVRDDDLPALAGWEMDPGRLITVPNWVARRRRPRRRSCTTGAGTTRCWCPSSTTSGRPADRRADDPRDVHPSDPLTPSGSGCPGPAGGGGCPARDSRAAALFPGERRQPRRAGGAGPGSRRAAALPGL